MHNIFLLFQFRSVTFLSNTDLPEQKYSHASCEKHNTSAQTLLNFISNKLHPESLIRSK